MPGDHPVHLTLSVSTAINYRPTHLRLGVTVEPLLTQHGDKRSEKGGSQTGIKDGFNVDDSRIGAIPLRQNGVEVGWGVAERDVGDNGKHGVAGLGEIRLELALDIDNEGGRDGGEQTSLFPQKL